MTAVCNTGVVSRFETDRARPFSPAVACNFSDGSREVGGVAIFSDPANAGENAPWYLINSPTMRFACAAILAPKVRTLQPDEKMNLHYRIAVRSRAWTEAELKSGN